MINKMANQFEPFDKNPVTSRNAMTRLGVGVKEAILGGLALIFLVLAIVFLALYVTNEADSDKDGCTTKECMETASRSIQLMNTSIDPCDDFFQYACGNYKTTHPVVSYFERTVIGDMSKYNKDRLEELILDGLSKTREIYSSDAYDRKVHDFVLSCKKGLNRRGFFSRGTSFQDSVITQLGGWHLLGTWNDTIWDFNAALKKTHGDLMVDALFGTSIVYNTTEAHIKIQQLLQLPYESRKYVQQLGTLLIRDSLHANLTKAEQETRLDQFVNDTLLVNNQKKRYGPMPYYARRPPVYEEMMTIQDLTELTKGFIDWQDLLAYMYRPTTITNQTMILLNPTDFEAMGQFFESVPDQDRSRVLHNYLMFRIFDFYIEGLPVEYAMAKDSMFIGPTMSFTDRDRYCITMTQFYMKDALGAIYVQNYFDKRSKQKVRAIVDSLKTSLKSVVAKTPWMDEETKKHANANLDSISIKIGYPEWMDDDQLMDAKYRGYFHENWLSFIDLLLSGNKFIRRNMVDALSGKNRTEEWIIDVFDTGVRLLLYREELVITAGLLQNPIYNVDAPLYKTFGSLGTMMGQYLHHVVDSYGEHSFGFEGSSSDKSWWSDQSLKNYKELENCVRDTYKHEYTIDKLPGGMETKIPMRVEVPVAIATTSGIRLALEGYRDWTKSRGISEEMLPGIGLSAEQMFFLSYAQNYCYNSKGVGLEGKLRGARVNVEMKQLQEFSQAFNCKPKSKMNPDKRCKYY